MDSAVSEPEPVPEAEPRRLRVLELETFGRGGLAHYVDNLSRALVELGHQVVLLTATSHELSETFASSQRSSTSRARSQPSSYQVERRLAPWSARRRRERRSGTDGAASRSWVSLRRKFEAVADVVRTVRYAWRLRPDLVHLHSTNSIALLHVLLLRVTGQRVVATAHVVTPHEPMPLQGVVYRTLYRLCHAVIAHSEFDRRRLLDELGANPERVAVIPHGEYGFFAREIEPPSTECARRELDLEPDADVALFFGYLREYKGLDVLLAAWPAVRVRCPRARLLVVGDPVRLSSERRAQLESEARDLGAVTRFEYVPFEEVARYFAAADVLVMPYRRVSQSGVLYLGLALGLPIVATRIGAWAEMLEHERDALLVPPEDPGELTEAIVRCLEDGAMRQRLAEGGRQLAAAHSWPNIARDTEDLFVRWARA